MSDDGTTKDDVKVPDGEVGDKIEKLFRTDEKDTSKTNSSSRGMAFADVFRRHRSYFHGRGGGY